MQAQPETTRPIRRVTMPLTHAQTLTMAAVAMVLLTVSISGAQEDGTQKNGTPRTEAAASEGGPVTVPAYLVGFTEADPDRATAVRITNLGTAPCATTVDWNRPSGVAQCRTFVTLPAGQTLDHCSNPSAGFLCSSTCPQPAPFGFRLSGTAIVEAESQCKNKIAVDAKVFYFNSNFDVVGVADSKVFKLPGANKGD